MKNNILKLKEFKTIEQQVLLLKKRGLNIVNENKLVYYLKSFNYQNFINGYNDPFFYEFRRSNNLYMDDVNEQSIIDLFNFDRTISNLILSNIQNIERILNTSISYCLAKKLHFLNYKNGEILNITNLEYQLIYENNLNNFIKAKKLFYYVIDSNKHNNLFKKFISNNNLSLIPIWTLTIFMSFGTLIKLLNLLNYELKYEIINCAFGNIFDDFNMAIQILELLKNVRNRCCHNNVIYNLRLKNNNVSIRKFLSKRLNINVNKNIKIYDIIRIIDFLTNYKNTKFSTSLKQIVINKIEKYIVNSKNINFKSQQLIFLSMNFY